MMSDNMEVNISFLFGAGVSIPAGMPTTEELTNHVMSLNGLAGPNKEASVKLLRLLKEEAEKYYSIHLGRSVEQPPPVSYEQVYYMLDQVHNAEGWWIDNPVIAPFREKIMQHLRPVLGTEPDDRYDDRRLLEFCSETKEYLRICIARQLSNKAVSVNHLKILRDCRESSQTGLVNIFTLNHDVVIEQFLESRGIPYSDGFGQFENQVRYWRPETWKDETSQARLYKLHGSVNWYWCETSMDPRVFAPVIVEEGVNPDFAVGRNGSPPTWIESYPMFLIGTHNKTMSYNLSCIYFTMQVVLFLALKKSSWLIVSGYSFGDSGVNARIFCWLESKQQGRMIVIDPDMSSMKRWAGYSVQQKLRTLRESGRSIELEKKIEQVSWGELVKLMEMSEH